MQRQPLSGTEPAEALEIALDLWQRASASVRRTPGLLLLSLLLGGALWVFVSDTENPRRVEIFPASIPVEAVNVGPALAVANTLPSVQVRVTASEEHWDRLTSANFRAFVDLNGLDAREQQVAVSIDVEGIGGVRVVEAIPSLVLVNLEDFVSKQVPALVRMVGTVPLGYEVDEVRPENDTVEISGPESLVELVRESVADVNVTGVTMALEQAVSLTPRGRGGGEIRGVRLNPPSMQIAVIVVQSTLTRTLPLEAKIAGQPASGYRVSGVAVSPVTVSVQGTIEALQGLESIALEPVNIAGLREGQINEMASLRLPDGVRMLDQRSATVAVSVTPVESSVRLYVAPMVVGLREGLSANFDEKSITVVLYGPLPILNAVTVDDVHATVDATDLDAATVDMPVGVQVPEGVSVAIVQPPVLSVTLTTSR